MSKTTDVMNWANFLRKLLSDFRTSSYMLDKEFGISQVAVHQILSYQTKKPQQSTIKKLEAALGIRINDSDPEHLSYELIGGTAANGLNDVQTQETERAMIVNEIVDQIRNAGLSAVELKRLKKVVRNILEMPRAGEANSADFKSENGS